jgi:hypothetical protein
MQDPEDLVPIAQDGQTLEFSELEAIEVQSLLAANGIDSVLRGASQLPSLPYEILVPFAQKDQAETVLWEARQAGPEAAEEAEAAGEAGGGDPPAA